jgi:Fe-S-cluster containining protein
VVVVTEREVEALARHAGVTPQEFRERHTKQSMEDTVLVDRDDGSCEWLERHPDGTTGCRVQAAKPDQCASYPFWPRVLRSRAAWDDEGRKCRGIGRGEPVPADEIDRRARLDEVRASLDLLLDELDAEVRDVGAACWLSGDCCDFPKAGHRLYATRIEAERFAAGVDLSAWDPAGGLCPAWKDGRCTARAHRPTACRTYFCDPNFTERVHEVTERAITRLKWLHERHRIPWDYRDWIAHLATIRAEAGEAPPPPP